MLLALVLAACVAPAAHEWVEISQQHYRKPSHTHTHPTSGAFYPANDETRSEDVHTPIQRIDKRPIYEEEQIAQNIPEGVFSNYSISEHKWNTDRDSTKRVVANTKIRANITPEFSLEIYGQVTESEPEQVTSEYGNVLKDKEIFSATIERVPNKGSVKRVQLLNTPVKSPSVTNAVGPIRRNDIRHYGSTIMNNDFSDEFEIKADIFQKAQGNFVTPMNHVKNLFSTKETTMRKYDRMDTSTSAPAMIFQKHPQTYQFNNFKEVNSDLKDNENISNIRNISIVEKNGVSKDEKNNTYLVKTTLEKNRNEERITADTPNIIAKNYNTNKVDNIDFKEVISSTDPKYIIHKDLNTKQNIVTSAKDEKNKNDEIKVNTMENVMKFIKVVADTISKNTNRGVSGKVKYLNELKETLLSSIKERIDSTWPDAPAPALGRGARHSRSPRGHVEFPSSESSLMTISFLTFAVFLIKLVLQVIHTYKNKAMMVAPLMVATAGRSLHKQHDLH